jgi:hypothetical protein
MHSFAQWVTGRPVRGFLAAGLGSLLVLWLLPLAAWVPAGLVVLALLASGPRAALLAALGAMLPLAWAFAPVGGLALGLGVPAVMLVPAYLASLLLERTRSLAVTFQGVTIAVCVLVVAVYASLGDPTGLLRPMLDGVRPAFEQTAQLLANVGVQADDQYLATLAWRSTAWLVMLHTLLAVFVGLWLFGKLREPGLFGREFRSLRLGRVLAIAMAAALFASAAAGFLGHRLPIAEDLAFLLSAAFMIQALAVVHALNAAQAFGAGVVVLSYLLAALMPLVLVGVGFADTWLDIRARHAAARK